MTPNIETDWTHRFRGADFKANDKVVNILNALTGNLQVDVESSNPRSISTVPTWHIFFEGVRVLAIDVNQGGILCRMLKMDYWPNNIDSHPGFRRENWNRGKTANVSLVDENSSSCLRPMFEKHLAILKSALGGNHKSLKKPRLDREHLKEQYFESEVTANLGRVESGLSLVRRQLVTSVGRLDLLCKDKRGFPVILELKVSAADLFVVEQLKRYVQFVVSETDLETRGIVVVKHKDGIDKLSHACRNSDLEIVEW